MKNISTLEEIYTQLESAADDGQLPLGSAGSDIVPGEGSAQAEVVFIGEAPGFHEAQQRRPFVGRSGKFLRKTLEDATPFSPPDVYITNIVKIRPPDNRDPSPEEIAAFKPYLDAELNVINPTVVATLGRFSMGKFLPDVKISQVHGRLHTVVWGGRRLFILPLYHPAAGLRNGNVRQAFIDDMAKLPKVIEWVKANQEKYTLEESVKDALF